MNVFTDSRDGCQYKIVKIGNLLWFAENLKYEGIDHHFPDRNSDNIEKYGCLYTWENAMRACPAGWRLPTGKEYLDLIGATDYIIPKDSFCIRDSTWKNGSNSSGFSALPAGYGGLFHSFGSNAAFWSSTLYESDSACRLWIFLHLAYVDFNQINEAFSVRYVKEI